jgi:hypothetical protein
MTTILQAVNQVTQDARVRAGMLIGAWLESGDNPGAVGDSGHAFGPWQINDLAHPGVSQSEASDPLWSANYMIGSYNAAAAQVPASLWSSNPERAAEQTAYLAERPAQDYYVARGSATVDSAWKNALAQLNGQDVSNDPNYSPLGGNPPTSSSNSSTANAQDVFSLNPLSDLKSLGQDLERIGFIGIFLMVGAAMVVLGLSRATGIKPKLSPALAAAAV